MELRALADHVALVAAVCEGRADDASSIARKHAKIVFELLEFARGRAVDSPVVPTPARE